VHRDAATPRREVVQRRVERRLRGALAGERESRRRRRPVAGTVEPRGHLLERAPRARGALLIAADRRRLAAADDAVLGELEHDVLARLGAPAREPEGRAELEHDVAQRRGRLRHVAILGR
jgi:hypothetical protein